MKLHPPLSLNAFAKELLDHSVYPDVRPAPDELPAEADRAEYVHRICSAFDFGVFPDQADWDRFSEWKDVFDRFPLPNSPAYHTFRGSFGWDAAPRGTSGLMPDWKAQDIREGRIDCCELFVSTATHRRNRRGGAAILKSTAGKYDCRAEQDWTVTFFPSKRGSRGFFERRLKEGERFQSFSYQRLPHP